MKLTNEIVFRHSAEWHAHGRDFYEFDDGDVLLLDSGLEVKITNDSHPDFLRGVAERLGDDKVDGVFIYGGRNSYIKFLKAGDYE